MVTLDEHDRDAGAVIGLIRGGDHAGLTRLLDRRPELATARLGGREGTRTTLHVATDWPGYFPDGPRIVELLIARGADPNAATAGPGDPETPLHWAASSDDLDVAAALIDGGADIDVPGGSIGTPLENAVGYGCWEVARLLQARGAPVRYLWVAAGLGLLGDLQQRFSQAPDLTRDELNHAFWQACHGGHRRVAEYLLDHGADPHATPDHNDTPPIEIAAQPGTRRDLLVEWLGQRIEPSPGR
ncbi:MAG TPA: ankyrin repeat domain-containing protein [Streptosporangiaceae bacterium]|nr:ankyrin repeat domain-containing protein [Streptosporangiaceae bacterium]